MAQLVYNKSGRLLFTEEMRQEYTILIPMMLPIHFAFLERILNNYGYKAELLKTTGRPIIDEGLQNVHNDTCYPALLVIGQMMHALKSGKYDLNKTALMITQTGGGCRASNYINLLRKALIKNNMRQVPVVSLNLSNLEKNPGFKLTVPLVLEMFLGVIYGDLLMWISNQVRPYEINKGDTDNLIKKWSDYISNGKFTANKFYSNACKIVKDFEKIPVSDEKKVKVGIVGEVYIKFAPLGNNCLEDYLRTEDVEIVIPGLTDMMLFMCDHHIVETQLYHVHYKKYMASETLKIFVRSLQNKMIKAINDSRFRAPAKFEETKKNSRNYVSPANKMGEGWLLTAEMVELINAGVENIVCTQPFGCLPNHIVGRGMVRKIKSVYSNANIVAIDYDPGATKVNQENRIKLMLSTAKTKLEQEKNNKNK